MNEFDSIEKELKALRPKSPSTHLIAKVESGLGDAGKLAMRRLPEEVKSPTQKQKSNLLWFPIIGMGIAATLIVSSLSYYYLKNGVLPEVISASSQPEPVPTILEEDPESPIHGVSVAELERRSGMPVGGWTPIFNKKLLDRIDEGVVSRPSGLPARQVRMRYIDEILWQHPHTEKRILSTQPRQEIILIDLDLY
jgi:hypothetical protein